MNARDLFSKGDRVVSTGEIGRDRGRTGTVVGFGRGTDTIRVARDTTGNAPMHPEAYHHRYWRKLATAEQPKGLTK